MLGQYIVVAVIVAVAAVYALRKFMPMAWRRRMVHALTRRGTQPSKLARWLDKDDSCGSGCNSCNSCETDLPAVNKDGKRVIKLKVER